MNHDDDEFIQLNPYFPNNMLRVFQSIAGFAGPTVPNTGVAMFQPSKGPDGSATAGQTAAQATYMSITHMAPYQVRFPPPFSGNK